MPTYVFPVQITLPEPLQNAGEGQHLCVLIEECLADHLGETAQTVVLQPVRGHHRRTLTMPDTPIIGYAATGRPQST